MKRSFVLLVAVLFAFLNTTSAHASDDPPRWRVSGVVYLPSLTIVVPVQKYAGVVLPPVGGLGLRTQHILQLPWFVHGIVDAAAWRTLGSAGAPVGYQMSGMAGLHMPFRSYGARYRTVRREPFSNGFIEYGLRDGWRWSAHSIGFAVGPLVREGWLVDSDERFGIKAGLTGSSVFVPGWNRPGAHKGEPRFLSSVTYGFGVVKFDNYKTEYWVEAAFTQGAWRTGFSFFLAPREGYLQMLETGAQPPFARDVGLAI